MASYLVGILAMVPFAVTSWYTGPVADALGGVDLAIFVGLGASGLSYVLFAKSIDLDHERAVAATHSQRYGEQAISFSRTDVSSLG